MKNNIIKKLEDIETKIQERADECRTAEAESSYYSAGDYILKTIQHIRMAIRKEKDDV